MMSAIRCGLVSLAFLPWPGLSFSQQPKPNFKCLHAYHFLYFQVSGASSTTPSSINDSLTVTGSYTSADGLFNGGFVRTAYGQLATFTVGKVFTGYTQINAVGEIAGMYQDVSGEDRGFIRSPNGSITKFNPGGPGGFTDVRGINNSGTIVGAYSMGNSIPPAQAYVRTRDGAITTFSIPGSDYVYPWGINDLGEVTGDYFYDGNTQVGGFVRSPGGIITTFNYAAGIVPLAINRAGTIIGWYGPPVGALQGFVRRPDGTIVPFRMPGMGMLYTLFMGINEGGFIAGSYTALVKGPPSQGSEEEMFGFIRSPEGVISSFLVPGSTDTTVVAINNFNVVVGLSDNMGPFIRIPDVL